MSPRVRLPGPAFENSYAALPDRFFSRLPPMPVATPRLIQLNQGLAAELGLDPSALDEQTWAAVFAGNALPSGADPIAMAYAGHQFGQFVPQLGDGRAILLGEISDRFGVRRDLQLKGSGRTPYSRGGDGRAALGPVLREFLVSEAMHALGIASTRTLAAVTTGEAVFRETQLRGAILTRVAASHVRVGTFQYFAARGDLEGVRRLADYVIDRHYPELKSAERPYFELLRAVIARQCKLVAAWMHVGFIHGVMNTDNMTVSGETIDFGPCAFMDEYHPATVFSSIDALGRYAYANQPPAAQWNLARLAETLLPLIDADDGRAVELANQALVAFSGLFDEHWISGMRAKLGLLTHEQEDLELVRAWLDLMQRNHCDYTLTFRRLCAAAQSTAADAAIRASCEQPSDFDEWAMRWRLRVAREPQTAAERAESMRRVNPAYIPRNHRIAKVIGAATEREDFGPFEELMRVLTRPYEEQNEFDAYEKPPQPAERVLQTFCGT
jgi:serine/tyrosine/threonine adenylyltransferase